MNPYSRFTTVSTLMAATLTIGAVLAFGMPAFEAISKYNGGQTGPGLMAATGASLALLVVGWLAMTEVIFPLVFRISAVRKMVLGKYYIEGTWLQAERGQDEKRMSVIDIQPDGNRFIFSGYSLNEELEIQSNIMIEFSRFEWPFMVYKYRNSLSDGSDGRRDGVGEIQLEMNRSSARRYNGFLQYVKSDERLKIEGAKLIGEAEVDQLRRLDGRHKIFDKYWKLFFHSAMRAQTFKVLPPRAEETPASDKAVAASEPHVPSQDAIKTLGTSFEPSPANLNMGPQRATASSRPVGANGRPVERRSQQSGVASRNGRVVPRRRASDWRDTEANGQALPIIRTRNSADSLNGTDN